MTWFEIELLAFSGFGIFMLVVGFLALMAMVNGGNYDE